MAIETEILIKELELSQIQFLPSNIKEPHEHKSIKTKKTKEYIIGTQIYDNLEIDDYQKVDSYKQARVVLVRLYRLNSYNKSNRKYSIFKVREDICIKRYL